MRTVGLSGKSGSGKSFKALSVANDNNIRLVVDDGLLIRDGKVLAGKSAKKEKSRYGSTLRAIFNDPDHSKEVAEAIKRSGENGILVLGTSEKMVNLISERIGVSPVVEHIHIEDVSTTDEIKTANIMRSKYGKHIIPVPEIEIKRTFSGYLLDPISSLKKIAGDIFDKNNNERTIIRPKYSYIGDFDISENVLCKIASYETSQVSGVASVSKTSYLETNLSIGFRIDVVLEYGMVFKEICTEIQNRVIKAIDDSASIYIDFVDVNVTGVFVSENG